MTNNSHNIKNDQIQNVEYVEYVVLPNDIEI